MTKKRVETVFSKVVLFLYELTGCLALVPRLKKLAEDKADNLKGYSDGCTKTVEDIATWAGELSKELKPEMNKESLEQLIWFIYLIFFTENEIKFEQIDLEPIRPAFKKMLTKLFEEASVNGIIKPGDDLKQCYEILMDSFTCLDKILKVKCEKESKERSKLSVEMCSFLLEKHSSKWFQRFALTFPTNINYMTLGIIDKEIKKTSHTAGKYTTFPPKMKHDITPIALYRRILEALEPLDAESADIGPAQLRREVAIYSENKIKNSKKKEKEAPRTGNIRMGKLGKFIEDVKDYKTVWVCYKKIEKYEEYEEYEDTKECQELKNIMMMEACEDHVGPDEDDYESNRQQIFFLCDELEQAKDTADHLGIPYDEMEKMSDEEFIKEKRKMLQKANLRAHQKDGNILRFIYFWENSLVLPYDVICTFLGYLKKKSEKDQSYNVIISIVLECLLTGASVKNIIYGKEEYAMGNINVKPARLFLSLIEMTKINDFNKETLHNKFISIVREYNNKYKLYRVTSGRLVYTARAWHISKSKYLTPLEVGHIAGLLPYTLSEMQYVVPLDDLVENLDKSNKLYLEQLIRFANGSYRGKNMFPEEINSFIDASISVIEEEQAKLKSKFNTRTDIWKDNKPKIRMLTTDQIYAVIILLEKRLLEAKTVEEWFIVVESFMELFDLLILMTRQCEETAMTKAGRSDAYKCAIFKAKDDRGSKEFREEPVPGILYLLQNCYTQLRDELSNLSIIKYGKNKKGNYYVYPDKSLKQLTEIIQEVTGDLKYKVYAIRKYAINRMHNTMVKTGKCSYSGMQDLDGHVFAGRVPLAQYDYSRYSEMVSIMEEYSKIWRKEIKRVIGRINESRKERLLK